MNCDVPVISSHLGLLLAGVVHTGPNLSSSPWAVRSCGHLQSVWTNIRRILRE